jgi:hypothetical protein
MRLNEHRKKGCEKAMDEDGNPLILKVYPPLRNVVEGVILAKGENVLEYGAKLEASSKPKQSHAIVTKIVPLMQQKRKKEKSLPMESLKEDVGQATEHGLTHKKHLTKPRG